MKVFDISYRVKGRRMTRSIAYQTDQNESLDYCLMSVILAMPTVTSDFGKS